MIGFQLEFCTFPEFNKKNWKFLLTSCGLEWYCDYDQPIPYIPSIYLLII